MATRSYVGKATLTGSGTSALTFTSQAIGTAASDRKVVVVAMLGKSTHDLNTNLALTIGGNAASRKILSDAENGDGSGLSAAIFSLDVPSGTTANIVLTPHRSVFGDVTIFVYALYGVSDAAAAVNGDADNFDIENTLDIDTTDGGILIAGAATSNSQEDDTWHGATADDAYVGESFNYPNHRSAASHVATSAETPRALSITRPADWNCCASVAAFFPAASGGAEPIDATANFTEPNETLSGEADVKTDAVASVSEPNESLSATATNLVTGSASFTEANETLSAATSHPVLAEAEFTEPDETLSASVAGSTQVNADFTEPDETIAAEASHPVVGNAAFTEADETLSGAATNPIGVSAAFTEANESLSTAVGVAVVAEADFTEANEQVGATVDTGAGGFGRSNLRSINIGRVGIGL